MEKSFGIVLFQLIETELEMLLNSQTTDNWDNAYTSTKDTLIDHPNKLELLDVIYNGQNYYSGYHLKNINCNMNLRGSSPAEQNHSSLHEFLDDNICPSLAVEV